ncbi:S8 family serine peptidase [Bradyrhizobium guangdongense]|uniref:S8 family serine peptidase n=1 Tax=Bradyrhizobium guangdongense TaxID=1325090 RepID=UPI001642F4B8|nr:S8 family serine peptidase [Bradyrhizobium guangdongense]
MPLSHASVAGLTQDVVDPTTSSAVSSTGATAAQVLQALNAVGAGVNGSGIKVGVISDSFNNKGGAAADEASGALPSAANVQVLKDFTSGGSDEGRAMMQIVHEIAPSASLAFYTADFSEQDFANGILALAAAGCKVICDDVSYFDEPFFQNGVIAQAIQTVEAQGVTYITSAGNNASNAYQTTWTHSSGWFNGGFWDDVVMFNGSIAQTITVTASSTHPVPLLLEWDLPYGQANFNSGHAPDIDMFVFQNGTLIAQATNASVGEANNPFTGYMFTASGTYQIVITNLFGPDPGLIKEVLFTNGLPGSISGANAGALVGHAMTPGVITAGAVSVASTPAFGVSPAVSETFSSSGAGAQLLFANDGTRLASPQLLTPVVVSSVDGIATTLTGGLSNFYGTSAASASLAGVAALLLSANPNLTPAQVEQIMEQTALPMANSAVSGAGLVQVNPAVTAAVQLLPAVVVEAIGSTELTHHGVFYFLEPVAGGIGPELRYGGAAVVVGGAGTWTPFAAEQTSGGYDIAWHDSSSGQYSIWTADSGGNFTSYLTGAVSGSSTTLENLENTFHQDLNGDGTIGVPSAPSPVVIESFGSTTLARVGSNFALYANGTSNGPTLKYGGNAVVAGQAGTWSLVGGEQTGSGYDVAWKNSSTGQFSIWTTDSNGNFTSYLTGAVSGTSTTLENLENTFHQDLNGDGTIGIPPSVIESAGSTSLVVSGNNYFFYTGGSGPSLKMNGSPVVVGQAGTWSPVAAEVVSGGYDVAWKDSSTGQFSIWSTDTNGNFTSFLTGAVAGNSSMLKSYEPIFHQDLNGDGTTGAAPLAPSGAVAAVAQHGGFVFAESGASPGAYQPEPLDTMPAPASWVSEVVEHFHDVGGPAALTDYLAAFLHDHQLLA